MTVETLVSLLLIILGAYLLVGFIFALIMLFKGVSKLDHGAKGSGWGFKLLIIPGTLVFWPLLWRNWRKAS
jgi:hypothetical protein